MRSTVVCTCCAVRAVWLRVRVCYWSAPWGESSFLLFAWIINFIDYNLCEIIKNEVCSDSSTSWATCCSGCGRNTPLGPSSRPGSMTGRSLLNTHTCRQCVPVFICATAVLGDGISTDDGLVWDRLVGAWGVDELSSEHLVFELEVSHLLFIVR